MFRPVSIALAAFLPVTSAFGATLSSSGITDLEVNGALYDVQFLDGSCSDHYDCASGTDFDFDEAGAEAAARAIADLFTLPENSAFNMDPSLTDGCAEATFCVFFVPYAYNPAVNGFTSWTFANFFPASNADVYTITYGAQFDGDQEVFAKFTSVGAPNVIPLPASALLLLGGLGALGIARSRRKPAA